MAPHSFATNEALLRPLADFESCDIADAIEQFGIRLRNQGFADTSIRCRYSSLSPMVGFAVTLQVRTAAPPISGGHLVEHSEWWQAFDAIPEPRVLVIEDVDNHPGVGAFVGKTHGHVFRALGAVGVVTNGALRDLDALEAMGMRAFSANTSVSHAYAHIVSVAHTVHVGGLAVSPGNILHGDRHGVVQIPHAIIDELPGAVQRHREHERDIIELCFREDFSVAALRQKIERDGWPGGLKAKEA
jgi:4-hydroxy-4-methyl-2-oxoglutarate aldolase